MKSRKDAGAHMIDKSKGVFTRDVKAFGTLAEAQQRVRYGISEDRLIELFTAADVSAAISDGRLDARPFQSNQFLVDYRAAESSMSADEMLAWLRRYHIERTAYLVVNKSAEPIELCEGDDGAWKDGSHRLFAAMVSGIATIDCIFVKCVD
jgi:hypothetical protein